MVRNGFGHVLHISEESLSTIKDASTSNGYALLAKLYESLIHKIGGTFLESETIPKSFKITIFLQQK